MTPNGVKPLIAMGATHGKKEYESDGFWPRWFQLRAKWFAKNR